MAPVNRRESSIDPTDEYDNFIAQLHAFHAERGTNFEPAPRVGNRRLDLLRLYKRVTEAGGYDVVSDIKSQKLAWRKMGQEFNLGTSNLPALAFNLKTAYYKNLAAFEIRYLHGRQPPPKEILEDVSAKGGDLLNRTVENYVRPVSRDEQLLGGKEDEGSEMEDHGTPVHDPMDIDELANSAGRVTRGLRQAPPQRVLFQPDLSTTRQTRHSSGHYNSPTPVMSASYSGINGSSNLNGLSPALANYEPRQPAPFSLKPVVSLSNNPEQFKMQQQAIKNAKLGGNKSVYARGGLMLPGTGFTGPNIYMRALFSLQSGIIEEQEYSLHHLVRISFERGDKYLFDGFPGLAEALVDKVLEVSSLFADIEWEVTYLDDGRLSQREALDGLNGTIDILSRIQAATPIRFKDDMANAEFTQRLGLINEAALVIRNMVMLEFNAEYLSALPTVRDALVIILNLPNISATIEIKHYALEIAEQLTKYYVLASDDPLHIALLSSIDSPDRGCILTSLRAISRLSLHLEHNVRLQDVPIHLVRRLCEWVLVEDEELRNACLDFLYQYTAAVDNVETLLKHADVEALVRQLVRLLLHNAQFENRKEKLKPLHKPPVIEDNPIPRISSDLIQDLLVYDEPERSSQWLRACFDEDPTGEITQIALWQAYQIPFGPFGHQRPLLPAKDFITNVSNTFKGASAQVIPSGHQPKFVIKGIKPRRAPIDRQGRVYMRCLWHMPEGHECGEFALRPKDMWAHLVTTHASIPKDKDGTYDLGFVDDDPKCICRWAGCRKYSAPDHTANAYTIGQHFKTHLPDLPDLAPRRQKHNHTPDSAVDITLDARSWAVLNTQTDERLDAAGLPLISVLVLRNLARNIPKAEPDLKLTPDGGFLVWKIFAPVKERLYHVMAYNQSLREYLPALARAIEAGGG